MVGEVAGRGCIRGGGVDDRQGVVIIQQVLRGGMQIARKALVASRAEDPERGLVCIGRIQRPQLAGQSLPAPMQDVGRLVGIQRVVAKTCLGNAPGIAANAGPQIAAAFQQHGHHVATAQQYLTHLVGQRQPARGPGCTQRMQADGDAAAVVQGQSGGGQRFFHGVRGGRGSESVSGYTMEAVRPTLYRSTVVEWRAAVRPLGAGWGPLSRLFRVRVRLRGHGTGGSVQRARRCAPGSRAARPASPHRPASPGPAPPRSRRSRHRSSARRPACR